jgi:pimeloyl-ACP methyl ester carboxylesterase
VDFTHDETADHSVTLADGRTLGYSEFGDPSGYPVLNNHGGLLCRFDIELVHDEARQLGVRVISPDRPGVGSSDPKPGRDTLDWADDVAELLTALGIDDFATMGWSMGGQYALAVAHRFGPRVRATAVIAGCPPLDDDTTFGELNEMDQKLTRLSQNHPKAAAAEFAAMAKLERHFPDRMAKLSSKKWATTDQEIAKGNSEWMGAAMVEAMRSSAGMAEEYRAWVRPWRFALDAVPGSVTIWQGTEDTLVPQIWGARLADEIPGATLRSIDGEGHMIAVSHRTEVLQDLLDRARAPR